MNLTLAAVPAPLLRTVEHATSDMKFANPNSQFNAGRFSLDTNPIPRKSWVDANPGEEHRLQRWLATRPQPLSISKTASGNEHRPVFPKRRSVPSRNHTSVRPVT
jgi:hypothetical protein